MNVNIKYFRVFVSVYEHMSMSAAGEELFLSQPAVSRIIRELEEAYSCRFFLRHSGRLYRTESGEKMYLHAKQLLSVTEQMDAAMQNQTRQRKVHIGATPTAGNYYLIDALAQYRKECGELDVYFSTHPPAILESMVKSAELDAAIADGISASQDVKVRPLFADDLTFMTAEGVYSTSDPLPLLVLDRGSANKLVFEQALAGAGISYTIKGQFSDVEGIRKCTALGMGVGVLPSRAADPANRLQKLEVPGLQLKTEFSLALHRHKFVFPELRELLAWIERRVNEIKDGADV